MMMRRKGMKRTLLAFLLIGTMVLTACTSAKEEKQSGDEQNKEWVFKGATAVNNLPSDEEILKKRTEVLKKGTLLYEGKANTSYNPKNSDWLTQADENGILVLLYTCTEEANKGWGIMGWNARVGGRTVKGPDITSDKFSPTETYIKIITMNDLATMFNLSSYKELESVSLGAWNGGHIIGLYYLPGNVASELNAYEDDIEKAKEINHTYKGKLSNENAIQNAKNVYEYMQDIQGKACLTGQMESTWMGTPNYEMIYVRENTGGKQPAIRGLDFIKADFQGVTDRAIEWWEKGGIVTICWHTGIDFQSAFDESMDDELNWKQAFRPGTATYKKLVEGMDRAVPYLQQLEDAGVPVLWRPFHETDGGWFWWSKGGAENFVNLWQMMYSRYTDYWGLDNLIWVLGYSNNLEVDKREWYPGDDYVDILGADNYEPGASPELWEACESIAPEGMPIVYHECGNIPTELEMKEAKSPWGYFLVWHTESLTEPTNNTVEDLSAIYNSDYFITLDELPILKSGE
jgi:hypothetical protein